MAQRCAVVTGGARNIGQAIGRRLQQDGYRVVALDIVEPEDASLRADARIVDLSDRAAAEVCRLDSLGARKRQCRRKPAPRAAQRRLIGGDREPGLCDVGPLGVCDVERARECRQRARWRRGFEALRVVARQHIGIGGQTQGRRERDAVIL